MESSCHKDVSNTGGKLIRKNFYRFMKNKNFSEIDLLAYLSSICLVPLTLPKPDENTSKVETLIWSLLPYIGNNEALPITIDGKKSDKNIAVFLEYKNKFLKISKLSTDTINAAVIIDRVLSIDLPICIYSFQNGEVKLEEFNMENESGSDPIIIYYDQYSYFSFVDIENLYKDYFSYCVELGNLACNQDMLKFLLRPMIENISLEGCERFLNEFARSCMNAQSLTELKRVSSNNGSVSMPVLDRLEKISKNSEKKLPRCVFNDIVRAIIETVFSLVSNKLTEALEKISDAPKSKNLIETFTINADAERVNLAHQQGLSNLYEILTCYPVVSNPCIRNELGNAGSLKKLRDIISHIGCDNICDENKVESTFEYLNDYSDKEILSFVNAIVSNCCKINTKRIDNILTIEVGNVASSNIISSIKSEIELHESIKEIHLIIGDTLFLNSSIVLPSKNLIIHAKVIDIIDVVNIKLSGLKGVNSFTERALSGTEVRELNNNSSVNVCGQDGENGRNGTDGMDSGCLSITAATIINGDRLTIEVNGGDGAKGQDGGDGEQGKAGKDGVIASDRKNSSVFFLSQKAFINHARAPEQGMKGGDGGHGGEGGKPGLAGKVVINDCLIVDNKSMQEIKKTCNDINIQSIPGNMGAPGSNGEGGKGGLGGKAYPDFAYTSRGYILYKTVSSGCYGEFTIVRESSGIFQHEDLKLVKTPEKVESERASDGEIGLVANRLDRAEKSTDHVLPDFMISAANLGMPILAAKRNITVANLKNLITKLNGLKDEIFNGIDESFDQKQIDNYRPNVLPLPIKRHKNVDKKPGLPESVDKMSLMQDILHTCSCLFNENELEMLEYSLAQVERLYANQSLNAKLIINSVKRFLDAFNPDKNESALKRNLLAVMVSYVEINALQNKNMRSRITSDLIACTGVLLTDIEKLFQAGNVKDYLDTFKNINYEDLKKIGLGSFGYIIRVLENHILYKLAVMATKALGQYENNIGLFLQLHMKISNCYYQILKSERGAIPDVNIHIKILCEFASCMEQNLAHAPALSDANFINIKKQFQQDSNVAFNFKQQYIDFLEKSGEIVLSFESDQVKFESTNSQRKDMLDCYIEKCEKIESDLKTIDARKYWQDCLQLFIENIAYMNQCNIDILSAAIDILDVKLRYQIDVRVLKNILETRLAERWKKFALCSIVESQANDLLGDDCEKTQFLKLMGEIRVQDRVLHVLADKLEIETDLVFEDSKIASAQFIELIRQINKIDICTVDLHILKKMPLLYWQKYLTNLPILNSLNISFSHYREKLDLSLLIDILGNRYGDALIYNYIKRFCISNQGKCADAVRTLKKLMVGNIRSNKSKIIELLESDRNHITTTEFNRKSNVSDLLSRMRISEQNLTCLDKIKYSYERLKQDIDIIKGHFDKEIESVNQNVLIRDWNATHLKNWVVYLKEKKCEEQYFIENVKLQTIAVICQAIRVSNLINGNWPRDTQIVALMIYIQSARQQQNCLGEISTGEGKTAIIAMFAAYQALCENKVNIISSSSVLAERDEAITHEFFHSLGISVANNCDKEAKKNTEIRRRRYTCQIVYGELTCFQHDQLLKRFHNENVLGSRDEVIVIIDEADHYLNDKGGDTLYISHDITDLRHIRGLFVYIWCAVHAIPFIHEEPETIIRVIAEDLSKQIDQSKLIIPQHLKVFVSHRLEIWIASAITARNLVRDDNFVLKKRTQDSPHEEVAIFDKATGVSQLDMSWSNGLHQFLQLSNLRRVYDETLKAVFQSNISYFQQYKGCLFGVTGTIGNHCDRNFNRIYAAESFKLPRHKESLFVEEESLVVESEELWLNKIKLSVERCITDTRSVLIVCENTKCANTICQHLEKNANNLSVSLYIDSDKKIALGTTQNPLPCKEIIISTNLGGRGTDLIIDSELEKSGGLKVILAYMPANGRVEEQAFGRAARQGCPGSGNFIVMHPTITDINDYRMLRDLKSIKHTEYLRGKMFQAVWMESLLLEKYKCLIDEISLRLKDALKIYSRKSAEELTTIQMKSLHARWAFFLDSIRELIQHVTLKTKIEIERKFDNFRRAMLKLAIKRTTYGLCCSPQDMICLGEFYRKNKSYRQASECFQYVIETEPNYNEVALFYSALVISEDNSTDAVVKRKRLKDTLRELKVRIENRISGDIDPSRVRIETLSVFLRNQGQGQNKNVFTEQIINEIALYRAHLISIDEILGFDFTLDEFCRASPSQLSENVLRDLYRHLIEQKNLIKPFRIRKKITGFDVNGGKLVVNLQGGSEMVLFPDIMKYMQRDIVKKLNLSISNNADAKRSIEAADFKLLLRSYSELFQLLLKHKYCSDITEHAILEINDPILNKVKFGLSDKDNNNDEVIKRLLRQNNKKYFSKDIFPDGLAETVINEIKKILFKNKQLKLYQKAKVKIKYDSETSSLVLNSELELYREFLKAICAGESRMLGVSDYLTIEINSYDFQLPLSHDQASQHIWKLLTFNNIIKLHRVNLSTRDSLSEAKVNEQLDKIKNVLGQGLKSCNIESDNSQVYLDYIMQFLTYSIGDLKRTESNQLAAQPVDKRLTRVSVSHAERLKFNAMMFDRVLVVRNAISYLNPHIFSIFALSCTQVAIGFALEVFTSGITTPISAALMSEGINDFIYAVECLVKQEFSWKQYGTHKAFSLSLSTLSILTFGTGAVARSGVKGLAIGINSMSLLKISAQNTAERLLIKLAKDSALHTSVKLLEQFVRNLPDEIQLRFGKRIRDAVKQSDSINKANKCLGSVMNELFKITDLSNAKLIISNSINSVMHDLRSGDLSKKLISDAFSFVQSIKTTIFSEFSDIKHLDFLLLGANIFEDLIQSGVNILLYVNTIPKAIDKITNKIKRNMKMLNSNSNNIVNTRGEKVELEIKRSHIDDTILNTTETLTSMLISRLVEAVSVPKVYKHFVTTLDMLYSKLLADTGNDIHTVTESYVESIMCDRRAQPNNRFRAKGSASRRDQCARRHKQKHVNQKEININGLSRNIPFARRALDIVYINRKSLKERLITVLVNNSESLLYSGLMLAKKIKLYRMEGQYLIAFYQTQLNYDAMYAQHEKKSMAVIGDCIKAKKIYLKSLISLIIINIKLHPINIHKITSATHKELEQEVDQIYQNCFNPQVENMPEHDNAGYQKLIAALHDKLPERQFCADEFMLIKRLFVTIFKLETKEKEMTKNRRRQQSHFFSGPQVDAESLGSVAINNGANLISQAIIGYMQVKETQSKTQSTMSGNLIEMRSKALGGLVEMSQIFSEIIKEGPNEDFIQIIASLTESMVSLINDMKNNLDGTGELLKQKSLFRHKASEALAGGNRDLYAEYLKLVESVDKDFQYLKDLRSSQEDVVGMLEKLICKYGSYGEAIRKAYNDIIKNMTGISKVLTRQIEGDMPGFIDVTSSVRGQRSPQLQLEQGASLNPASDSNESHQSESAASAKPS